MLSDLVSQFARQRTQLRQFVLMPQEVRASVLAKLIEKRGAAS